MGEEGRLAVGPIRSQGRCHSRHVLPERETCEIACRSGRQVPKCGYRDLNEWRSGLAEEITRREVGGP